MNIYEYISQKRLVLDGAMGTYFAHKEGLESAVSELALETQSDKIKAIHKEYIEAGATLLKTNTFMLNPIATRQSIETLRQWQHIACEILRQAVKESGKTAFIAGDIGPIYQDIESTEEAILAMYYQIIDGFIEEQVDAILFETFTNALYLEQLSKYIKEKAPSMFIITSFCLNKNGYTTQGISAKKLLAKLSAVDSIDSIGFNCGIGSGHMNQLLKTLKLPKSKYIIASPNAGYPEQMHNRMIFMNNTVFFAENAKSMLEQGVAIIGSCCGTNPAYTKELVTLTDEFAPIQLEKESFVVEVRELSEDANETKSQQPNSFLDRLNRGKKVIAVELDPPYDANDEHILTCAEQLREQGVDLITLADSPRGRSRIDSILMSIKLNRVTQMEVMPHVCCRDRNMVAMRSSLLGGYVNDIRNLLIVTGDPLPAESRLTMSNVFDYNSIRLMEFVQEMNEEHFPNDPFIYGGALNYSGANVDKIVERMEKKLDAGASYFLTQPVYSEDDMERIQLLRNRTQSKILIGIMPFVSWKNANFVKNEFAGIHVPEEIVARYHKDMSREEAEQVGAILATEIIQKTKDICDGYYMMLPFNRVSMMGKIVTVF